MNWVIATVLATFFMVIYAIGINKFSSDLDNKELILNVFIISGILAIVYHIVYRKSIRIFSHFDIRLLLLGIFFVLTAGFIMLSLKLSPNPAISRCIMSTNSILVLLVLIYFYKEKVNSTTIMGIVITILGLCLIFLNNKNISL